MEITTKYLHGANLCGANLRDANLRDAKINEINESLVPLACPEFGSFTAFKKAGECLVTLIIPEDALRSSATGRKCRCNKAKVVDILPLSEKIKCPIQSVPSDYDSSFVYTIGETVEVNDFDTNRFNECAPGIHFFITKQEAIDY